MSRINDLIKEMCPRGVEYKKICDVCNVVGRIGFRGYKREDQVEKGKGAISLSPSNIINGKINYNECTYISWDKYNESPEIMVNEGDVIFCKTASVGKTCYVENMPEKTTINPQLVLLKNISINSKYLSYCLQTKDFQIKANSIKGLGTIPTLSQKDFNELTVPVPPLEIQKEIVQILDKFGELEARKSQYEFWREKLLNTGNSNQEYITLGDIGKVCMCKRIMKNETSDSGDVPFYKIGTFGKQADAYISYDIFNDYKKRFSYPKKGEILVSCSGTIGRSVVFDGEDAYFQDSNIVWLSNGESKVLNKFLYYFYQTSPWNISDGGTIKRLYNNQFMSAKVPLYSLEEQKKIVNILERFDKLINDITVGLPAEIELRRKQYEYYRNKLLSFEELSVSE